jgi:GTP cyclohydrolase IA
MKESTAMDTIETHIKDILSALDENPEREGLQKTPARVAQSLRFLTKGYKEDPFEIAGDAIFKEEQRDMIIIKDVQFFSLCEHHMLPFFGRCHVGYIPNGRIIGLSKIARLIDIFARRLQVQERMTRQIADVVQEILSPRGVAVVTEAEHLCMQMRGVERQNSTTISSSMLGLFRENIPTRAEFMSLIRKST